MTKILCVAEKPSIAKAVANHLAGGQVNTVSRQDDNMEATSTDVLKAQHPRQCVRQEL